MTLSWFLLISLFQLDAGHFAAQNISSLGLSLISVLVAAYMYERKLLNMSIIVTTAFIVVLALLLFNYATYDESDGAYILNEVYLHGSFSSWFYGNPSRSNEDGSHFPIPVNWFYDGFGR